VTTNADVDRVPTGADRGATAWSKAQASFTAVVVVGVVIFGSWEIVARAGLVHQVILPPPSSVLGELWFFVTNLGGVRAYWFDTWITLQEILLGFALGSVVGLFFGAVIAESTLARRGLLPYAVALNSMPRIAFAPLFIVWFGFGITPKVLMAAFICVFPVFVNSLAGFSTQQQEQLDLMASLRASRWRTFWSLKVPQSLPYVFAGLKTAMAFAVIGAIIGEFEGAQRGIGYLIKLASSQLRVDRVFALLIVLSLLGLVLYKILELVERRVVFWHHIGRTDGATL
jgi:NitT/TauT family transport system permease protein